MDYTRVAAKLAVVLATLEMSFVNVALLAMADTFRGGPFGDRPGRPGRQMDCERLRETL